MVIFKKKKSDIFFYFAYFPNSLIIFQIRELLSKSAEPFATVTKLSAPGLAGSRGKQLSTATHPLCGLNNTMSTTHIVRGLLGNTQMLLWECPCLGQRAVSPVVSLLPFPSALAEAMQASG